MLHDDTQLQHLCLECAKNVSLTRDYTLNHGASTGLLPEEKHYSHSCMDIEGKHQTENVC